MVCQRTSVCGDRILTAPEQCDDGNAQSGDGCSAMCTLEPGFICPAPGMPCQHSAACGDRILTAPEQCDDGNTLNGDGCSAMCTLEPGFICPAPGMPCQRSALCGDRILTAPEQCDDGNLGSGDGCSAMCTLEPGFSCPAPGFPCQRLQVCGDGFVEMGEQCDLGSANGHTTGGPGCSASCQLEYKLFQEAESGVISAPLQKVADMSASGGQYVQVIPGNNSTAAAPMSGFANFAFSVGSGGTYRVFGKFTAPTTSDDSFWVRMDGGPWVQWNDIFVRNGAAAWKWDEVHDTVGGNALVRYPLMPGSHTLTIAYREDGAKLDQILITNDLALVP
jgi:cysteine-rich repeat protein